MAELPIGDLGDSGRLGGKGDVDAVLAVLHDLHVDPFKDIEASLGEDRMGIGDESSLELIILPAFGEQIGKDMSFFGHIVFSGVG